MLQLISQHQTNLQTLIATGATLDSINTREELIQFLKRYLEDYLEQYEHIKNLIVQQSALPKPGT